MFLYVYGVPWFPKIGWGIGQAFVSSDGRWGFGGILFGGMCKAAGDRYDRSRDRSIDSIDSIIFRSFGKNEKTHCVERDELVRKSSKPEPSSQFFGRLKIFAIFGSIGSIFSSTPSVMCQRVVLDRPANKTNNWPAYNRSGDLGIRLSGF